MDIRPLDIPMIDSTVIICGCLNCSSCAKLRIFTEASQKSPGAIAPGQKGLGLARIPGSGLNTRFPLGFRQHDLGIDAGAGVNQVVAEEDLRGGSAGSASSIGQIIGVTGDTFTSRNGNWIYTWDRDGKKVNTRAVR